MFILFLVIVTPFVAPTFGLRKIYCRDPYMGSTNDVNQRKYLLIGHYLKETIGLGNQLIFFPAAYYFAALTGRDILINENSSIGNLCSIIRCGFPMLGHAVQGMLGDFDEKSLYHDNVPSIQTFTHFRDFMEEKRNYSTRFVGSKGFQCKSDWWIWFDNAVQCVQKLTSCDIGDIHCTERHSLQRLIIGPFIHKFSKEQELKLFGFSESFKRGLYTLPHSYLPRIDLAIHMRNQFLSFEKYLKITNATYRDEVEDWLNSLEENEVIGHLISCALEMINSSTVKDSTKRQTYTIYVAADNERVKSHFLSKLTKAAAELFLDSLQIMAIRSDRVYHVKYLETFPRDSPIRQAAMFDIALDWYLLTLSNTILSWRKGGSPSTFVASAQKVSGSKARTNAATRSGLGTVAYLLSQTKRTPYKFNMLWQYSFLPQYSEVTNVGS
jgi:hypothetical protein